MYLALDKTTGDLILKSSGGVERVSEGRFIVQQVQSKLRAWLGEWLLDPTVGWLNSSDFEKIYSRSDIEQRAREIILATQGVSIINSMETDFKNRKLTLSFSAETIYGTIDLTVPWGN